MNALKGHYELDNPRKALVLSFHGRTGTGKNYVAQFIAEAMYLYGQKSKFFRYFSATKDFPHNEQIIEYKDRIKREVEETVSKCDQALFVFDEMDKAPIGLTDVLLNYVDINYNHDKLDFRKSVFIFLSNSASNEIVSLTLDLEEINVNRDQFELKEFQKKIESHVYKHKNEQNKGLWHSALISNYAIDYFIPFLPLQRTHVKQCIHYEMEKVIKNYEKIENIDDVIDKIADEMVYEPPGYNKYSLSGCKKVNSYVRKFAAEHMTSQKIREL